MLHEKNQALSEANVNALAKEVEGYLERVTKDKYVYLHWKALELYKKAWARIITVDCHWLVAANITKWDYAWSFLDRNFCKKHPDRVKKSTPF